MFLAAETFGRQAAAIESCIKARMKSQSRPMPAQPDKHRAQDDDAILTQEPPTVSDRAAMMRM